MDELTISVVIADRSYRLTVKRDEEEMTRKAAGDINKKVKNYAQNFAYNDKQDLLAMVALENAINYLQTDGMKKESFDKLISELTDIEEKLPDIAN
ncbi:MAG: cell division protein ZapA [Bacteroidales bacterium]|nr:cell division protein ZapA [Bacteroidales bacterium]